MRAYVITAYRWGMRDTHSYVVGCSQVLEDALEIAKDEREFRGGKYICEVVKCETSGFCRDRHGELNVEVVLELEEHPFFKKNP